MIEWAQKAGRTLGISSEAPIHSPDFAAFLDLHKRRARVAVEGAFETVTEPIKNPATGQEHRIQVCLPEGFEYTVAEIGNAAVNRGTGTLTYDWPDSHSLGVTGGLGLPHGE